MSLYFEYYTENEEKCLRNLVERCGKAERVIAYKKLYPQIVIAAGNGMLSACMSRVVFAGGWWFFVGHCGTSQKY